MKNYILTPLISAATLLAVANLKADVTLSLNDPNSPGINSAYCSYSGLTASVNDVADITGGQWIGIYGFTVAQTPAPVPNVTSPFYSICVSPGGDLQDGSYVYNSQPIASASQINPGGWAASGIQNAAFLFSAYEPSIVGNSHGDSALSGSTADQGTALALAIYDVLWNSTALGKVGTGTAGNGFYITGFGDSSIQTDYSKILNDLTSYSATTGANILVPANSAAAGPSGQEFILLGGQVTGSPVPEPSTIFAGLLLLLPFGAGVFRIVRKKSF